MVRAAFSKSIARDASSAQAPDHIARATALATGFAERAGTHDREASFPFENFKELSDAGLLALTVPAALGGLGAGVRDAASVLGIIAKADPSTALVLSMHYINHLVMARSERWPGRLARKLAKEAVEGVALINALRVEPELGSPARGGAASHHRTPDRDRLAPDRTQDLFDRRAHPEMVRGVGQDR